MNREFLPAEMLHFTDMTVLERLKAHLKWKQEQLQQQLQLQQQQQQQQQQQDEGSCSYADLGSLLQGSLQGGGLLGEVVTQATAAAVKPDPGFVDNNGWSDFVGFGPCGYGNNNNNGSGFEMNFAISRTYSRPPAVAAEAAAAAKGRESVMSEKMGSAVGRESFKKRKVDKIQNNTKVVGEDNNRDKRTKRVAEDGESKITEKNNNKSTSSNSNSNNSNKNSSSSNKENSGETSKNNSKVTDVQKPDYVHVRARRGQATDSHSLAERVRREKISKRMKYLQDLVPGCSRITGKAGMLDEIINYVQSLQRQVEFLSMKLAALNPRLDFNIDNLFAKEAFPTCSTNFPASGMSTDVTNPAYLQFNYIHHQQQQQQIVTCSGLDMAINPSAMGPRQTVSVPVSAPEMFLDSFSVTHMQTPSTWDADLQNLYNVAFDQGRSTSFPSQPFTGSIEAGNPKM